MTPAEPNEAAEPTPSGPPERAEAPSGSRRRWLWPVLLVLLVLVVAAAVGVAIGVGVVLRGRSFGTPLPADPEARPTFVVARVPSPSPSPNPSGTPRPAAVPTSATSATASDEYTVQAGDTLRSIAQQVYGDAAHWSRLYDANRDTIGSDPDMLNADTRLRIPRP